MSVDGGAPEEHGEILARREVRMNLTPTEGRMERNGQMALYGSSLVVVLAVALFLELGPPESVDLVPPARQAFIVPTHLVVVRAF